MGNQLFDRRGEQGRRLLFGRLLRARFAIEETSDRPQVQADLRQARTAVERASNLTRQLLTFPRGDAIQPQDVDLNASLEEVHAMLDHTIGEHITLIAIPREQPMTVHADPGQIQQILLNLAINARDAMPEGGTIVLEANLATLDGDEIKTSTPTSTSAPPSASTCRW